MQNPLEDENYRAPPAAVIAITQSQLAWTIAVASVLFMANLLTDSIADNIARFQTGDEYYRLRAILNATLAGLMIAQFPMVWIWLCAHVLSRSLRMVLGWLAIHVILVAFFISSNWSQPREWDWEQLAGAGLLTYLLFLMTGWFIHLFAYRCGLSHLWAVSNRHSRLSIGDLLSFTLVAAMVMGEFMVIRESIPWAIPQALIVPFLMLAFVAVGAAAISTVALGSVYSTKSIRFRWMFVVLVIFGPTLVVGVPVFVLRVVSFDNLIATNLATWIFVATLSLLFPTLPRRT